MIRQKIYLIKCKLWCWRCFKDISTKDGWGSKLMTKVFVHEPKIHRACYSNYQSQGQHWCLPCKLLVEQCHYIWRSTMYIPQYCHIQLHSVLCRTVQFLSCAKQCSSVQCSAVKFCLGFIFAVLCIAGHFFTVKFSSFSSFLCSAVQFSAVKCRAE